MKKKINPLFSFLSVVFAVLSLTGCDMDSLSKPFTPPPAPPPQVSYLTVINLPANIGKNHVSNVSVSNQLNIIAECQSYDSIIVDNTAKKSFRAISSRAVSANNSHTIKIPLVFSDTKRRFDSTGTFFISLDINVDSLTRYTIALDDNFPLDFNDGNATLDASLISYSPCLTIVNLPANTQKNHFSNVFVYNSAGVLAKCSDYNRISIKKDDDNGSVTAKIPLSYDKRSDYFIETGVFIVSFTVNIDYSTYYNLKESDKISLYFTEGNATLDITNIPAAPPPPYLSIINLPGNTIAQNFSNVFVYNSAGVLAKCSDYNQIQITKNNNSVTAKIPLSYNNRSDFFKETGTFIVAFKINIDYATYYNLKESDKQRLYFTEGNATFDASLIPPPPPPYLTVKSLPGNTKSQNISNVFVYDASGTLAAKCADYDQIVIIRDGLFVTAKIPLYYADKNERFIDTGNFVVSLYVNINFDVQIILNKDDNFTVFFSEGNATLDASAIPPAPPPPYLTITSLPKNTKAQNFSNVFVYNGAGTAVARCADYNQIIFSSDSDYAAAKIPLVYSSGGRPFRDSGSFYVSFSLNIDSYFEVKKTRDDAFSVQFTDGSGSFDLLKNALSGTEPGYFSVTLANPSDTEAPVIRGGSRFEMNGSYYTVSSNTAVAASAISNTCIVYVYARLVFNQLEFVYSTTPPSYDGYKKGYYSGLSRCLFKFVFIRDSTNKYFAKIPVHNNWSHLNYQTVESTPLSSQSLSQHYFLSGTGNPQQHTVTLPAGVYLFTLSGAAGGSSAGGGGVGNSGTGGHVSEVVILSQNTSFTFFTGEKGRNGESNPSYQGAVFSGGGGGSGSFAFTPDGYLLCAGGGGGGAAPASSLHYYFGDGGAGGSIGGGGAGGSNKADSESIGGDGGGYNGGQAGLSPEINKNGYSGLTVYSYSLGFEGNSSVLNSNKGGSAAYFDLPYPNNWLNTNNANGKGGDSSGAAQSGGNNRNSNRGGGGTPSSANSAQSNGSVIVYKIN